MQSLSQLLKTKPCQFWQCRRCHATCCQWSCHHQQPEMAIWSLLQLCQPSLLLTCHSCALSSHQHQPSLSTSLHHRLRLSEPYRSCIMASLVLCLAIVQSCCSMPSFVHQMTILHQLTCSYLAWKSSSTQLSALAQSLSLGEHRWLRQSSRGVMQLQLTLSTTIQLLQGSH